MSTISDLMYNFYHRGEIFDADKLLKLGKELGFSDKITVIVHDCYCSLEIDLCNYIKKEYSPETVNKIYDILKLKLSEQETQEKINLVVIEN